LREEEVAGMKQYIVAYFAVLVVFVGLDVLWLSVMTSRLYKPGLSPLLAAHFSPGPVVLFYLGYGVGVVILAVSAAIRAESWATAAFHGMVLGFCAYGTYDLTNQATLRGWPLTVTLVDLAWGTALTAIAATVGYGVAAGRLAHREIAEGYRLLLCRAS
jgi:uncharacterized membrane protein